MKWVEGDRVKWWCPGCESFHIVPVSEHGAIAGWLFNGDLEVPTLTPSVKVMAHKRSFMPSEQEGAPLRDQPLCHSFVRDGHIQFLLDCEHALAGQTVPMAPVIQ